MEDLPLSKSTLKRAYVLGTSAKKMGFKEPAIGIMEREAIGDTMVYMFTNKTHMYMVFCCSNCYLLMHGKKNDSEKDADLAMVSNIKLFLQGIKKEGYESVTREEMTRLQKTLRESRNLDREPSDEELNEEEEDEE